VVVVVAVAAVAAVAMAAVAVVSIAGHTPVIVSLLVSLSLLVWRVGMVLSAVGSLIASLFTHLASIRSPPPPRLSELHRWSRSKTLR